MKWRWGMVIGFSREEGKGDRSSWGNLDCMYMVFLGVWMVVWLSIQ